MRWRTDVECPRKCGGRLDAYDETTTNERVEYLYICPDCGNQGTWASMARSLHPAPYRGKGAR